MRVWHSRLYTTTIFLFSDSDLCEVCGHLFKHQSLVIVQAICGASGVRMEPKKENDVTYVTIKELLYTRQALLPVYA